MIDSRELRIGNWVLNFGNYFQIRDGEDIDDNEAHKCFQPIPLTRALLDSLDDYFTPFESRYYFNGEYLKGINKNYICLADSDKFKWERSEANTPLYLTLLVGRDKIEIAVTYPRYLHQLQNIYLEIMGKEITLKQPITV